MGNPYVQFLKQIKSIDDTDYGDFMRRANLYLNELQDESPSVANPVIAERIQAMKQYVQYKPNWDIESTRQNIEADAENLIFLDSIYSS